MAGKDRASPSELGAKRQISTTGRAFAAADGGGQQLAVRVGSANG